MQERERGAVLLSMFERLEQERLSVSRIMGYLPIVIREKEGTSRQHSSKELACQCWRRKRHECDLWVRKIPWSRKWDPAPVFLPGKFHGQKNLVGFSPWGCRELDTTEHTHKEGKLCGHMQSVCVCVCGGG